MKKIYITFLFSLFSFYFVSAQNPVAGFAAIDTLVCFPDNIYFNNQSTNATSWEWNFPGATPSSSTQQYPQVFYNSVGTYDVTQIAINGVKRDTLTKTNYITAKTFAAPVLTLVHDTIYAVVDPGTVYTEWRIDSMPIVQVGGNYLVIQEPGNYVLHAESKGYGCWMDVGINVTLMDMDYNTVKGRCYIDYNMNNIYDVGEPPYNQVLIQTVGSGSTRSMPLDAQGEFFNYITVGGVVQTSLLNLSPAYTCSSPVHTSSFPSFHDIDSVDFAIVPIPGIRDIRISMIPTTIERIGRDVIYRIVYVNAGSDTVSAGTVKLIKDSRLTLVSSNPTYFSVSGDTILWNYANFKPNDVDSIDVTLHIPIPPTVNPGDTLQSTAVLAPLSPNANPKNNYAFIRDIAVGSYDPNDKAALFGDHITTTEVMDGQYLTYLIRFQNTGNYYADDVVIKDSLDSKLDITTFSVISSSHSYTVGIENESLLSFAFKYIFLPAARYDSAGSQGYICYRIKPLANLANGDVIENTADIYFDYNPPITTNTVYTTVRDVLGVDKIKLDYSDVFLFPNPASNQLIIHGSVLHAKDAITISVVNMLGETMHQQKLNWTGDATVNIKNLSAGIYFLQLKGESGSVVRKFVKE